jgi:ABC-type multidrug transport system permease subunit
MIQPKSGSSGLRPVHGVAVVAAVVVVAVIVFGVFHFIVGVLAFFIKLVIVIAVLYGLTRFVLRHAKG